MDAVGGTVNILQLLQLCLSHVKQARRFEIECRIYEIRLLILLSRCAAIPTTIPVPNATGDTNSAPQDREPTAAEIVSAIQDTLHIARCEAAKIRADCSTQAPSTGFVDKLKAQATKTIESAKWALYKRDNCNKLMKEISAMIRDLERQVDRARPHT